MIFIFDACTVINMIHIDEDEFLLKQLTSLDFHICKTVFDEIDKNVANKFKNYKIYPEKELKEIEKKLNNFRDRIYSNEDYLSFAEEIGKLTGYKKANGEFHSTLLSTYINTIDKAFVHFYTDDLPATIEFSPFLSRNQIGQIKDSVDLLVLLYRHSDTFNKSDLKRYLSSLFSEYVVAISAIEKAIEEFEIPKNQIKNRRLRIMRDDIRKSTKELQVIELQKLYYSMYDDRPTFGPLINLLSSFQNFFDQHISRDYLNKIRGCISSIDTDPYYKFAS